MDKKTMHAAAVALGRKGGLASAKVSTPAKQAASRANGKRGGRPKRAKKAGA